MDMASRGRLKGACVCGDFVGPADEQRSQGQGLGMRALNTRRSSFSRCIDVQAGVVLGSRQVKLLELHEAGGISSRTGRMALSR